MFSTPHCFRTSPRLPPQKFLKKIPKQLDRVFLLTRPSVSKLFDGHFAAWQRVAGSSNSRSRPSQNDFWKLAYWEIIHIELEMTTPSLQSSHFAFDARPFPCTSALCKLANADCLPNDTRLPFSWAVITPRNKKEEMAQRPSAPDGLIWNADFRSYWDTFSLPYRRAGL